MFSLRLLTFWDQIMFKIKWFLSSNLSLVFGNWKPNLSNDDHSESLGLKYWWVPNQFLEYCISEDSYYNLKYKKQVDDSLKINTKINLKATPTESLF